MVRNHNISEGNHTFLDDLFPFHLVMDKDLIIQKVGTSMHKLLEIPKGSMFYDFFSVERPLRIDDFESFIKHQPSLFIFKASLKEQLKFRGQMYHDKLNNTICFLGSPLLRSFTDLNDINLNLQDFAVHDSISHFLFALQIQTSALQDAQLLAAKLKKNNKALKEVNESLDTFTYRLTHDLRAPAININNMLNMLQREMGIDVETRADKILNYAFNSSQKLLETIKDFLELSRLEKQNDIQAEKCSLRESFNFIQESLQQSIDESNAVVNVDFSTIDTVYFIKDDLRSIFQNLLNNAIKYKSEKRDPVIHIHSTYKNNKALIIFSDNGRGMDLEVFKDKIFTMFSRFHADSGITGSGIGLYLIKKILNKYDCNIEIESEIDRGTTFKFELPLK